MRITKRAVAMTLAAGLTAPAAQAANWLQIQGTEAPGATDRLKLWGFIQPQYTETGGSDLDAGPWNGQKAVFNQIGPDLDSDSSFQIRRARIGARGTNFPLDGKTNYFLLLEAGNNGITKYGNGSVALTDASVTFNQIPYARVRVGQFKYPGAEEGLQAIHVFDYIEFTNVTNNLLLERFFDGDGSNTQDSNSPNGSVGAFRDIGVQVFDWFNTGSWQHTYAAMVGDGNGLNRTDDNGNKDIYLYWSSEQIYGGQGARREGWKMFAWGQTGQRTLEFVNGVQDTRSYDRDRWGLGTTFRKGKYRAAAEYIYADGMIFNGTDGGAVPGTRNNADTATASWNIEPNGEADGWYIDLGYRVLPKWELDVRYDYLDRMKNVGANEREFTTWTLGAQYFINKKTRALLNYQFRDADAPDFSSSATPNQILDNLDNRVGVQVLAIF